MISGSQLSDDVVRSPHAGARRRRRERHPAVDSDSQPPRASERHQTHSPKGAPVQMHPRARSADAKSQYGTRQPKLTECADLDAIGARGFRSPAYRGLSCVYGRAHTPGKEAARAKPPASTFLNFSYARAPSGEKQVLFSGGVVFSTLGSYNHRGACPRFICVHHGLAALAT